MMTTNQNWLDRIKTNMVGRLVEIPTNGGRMIVRGTIQNVFQNGSVRVKVEVIRSHKESEFWAIEKSYSMSLPIGEVKYVDDTRN